MISYTGVPTTADEQVNLPVVTVFITSVRESRHRLIFLAYCLCLSETDGIALRYLDSQFFEVIVNILLLLVQFGVYLT